MDSTRFRLDGTARHYLSRGNGLVFAGVLLVMFAVLLALPRPVAAVPANESCMDCHTVALDMAVAPVDFETACKSCHLLGLAGSHPTHQIGANCGGACHQGWGSSDLSRTPLVTDPVLRASFASLGSKSLPSEALHAIHSKPSWPAAVQGSPLADACRSCHATAACNACHAGALSPAHKNHSAIGNETYAALAPWAGITGRGVVGGDLTMKSAVLESSQCGTPGCHRIAEMQSKSPRITEDYNYSVGGNPADPTGTNSVITTGTWRTRYATSYTGGRMSFTTVAEAEIQASVSGGRVEIIGETDPYRGTAQVLLDGTVVGTFDEYAPTTTRQAVVYSLTLPAGTHTVTVRSTGEMSAWARAAFVVVDGFRVYPPPWSVAVPTCVSCHDFSTHPASGVSHTANTDTASGTLTDFHAAATPYSFVCAECHAANVSVEHVRSSTSTTTMSAYPDTCYGCHRLKVDNLGAAWDGTCAGNGNVCHPSQHDGAPAGHDPSSEVMAAPGSESRWTSNLLTPINTGWETGRDGWSFLFGSGTVSGVAHSGNVSAEMKPAAFTGPFSRYGYKTVDTSGIAVPTLEFWSMAKNLTASDILRVWYTTSGGEYGTKVYVYSATGALAETTWMYHTVTVPRSATLTVGLELYHVAGTMTRYAYFDDIKLSGNTPQVWTTTAVPAGSTATRSCGSGYLYGTANCHDVSDLTDVHSKASLTIGADTYTSCLVCHRDDASPPTSANCQSAGCHPGVNAATHASDYHQTTFGSDTTGPFASTGFQSQWCTSCHFSGIAEEHRRIATYGTNGCAVCHRKSTDSASPLSITAANTATAIHADATPNNAVCSDCHATQTASTPHVRLGTGLPQFDPTYSGHRVYNTLRGAVTSGVIGAVTITDWQLPPDATWLKTVALGGSAAAQLTPSSMVRCDDCHGSIAGATGPHGATMRANYATNPDTGQPYDNSYTTGGLYIAFPSGFASYTMSNTTALCNKCHVRNIGIYNNVHGGTNKHLGTAGNPSLGKCINCHTPVPHAWKRPRLLGYTDDPAPYATLGLTALRVRDTETTWGWGAGDCGSGCGHGGPYTRWP